MKTWEVKDRDRTLTFEGELLGEASSYRSGKDRWTEARIFRTEAGSFVVAIIGRSTLDREVDRCRAQVCETADGAVESLYQYDDNQVRYMTRTVRDAAEQAATVSDEFRTAFTVEHVA